eukprot:gb/GECH01003117.1/.p1 GENE.gb/GECH01003117.1/~~gb/GECH01003117.1/.p1  ORF type:complete len:306 (+),score=83.06 gb/GECH01003117.1/:1-918(+)
MEPNSYSPFGMLRVRSRDGRKTYYSTDEDAHALESSDSGLDSGENMVPVRIQSDQGPSSHKPKKTKKKRGTQLPRNMGRRKLRRWVNDHFLDSPHAVRLDPSDPKDQEEINSLFSVDYNSVFSSVVTDKHARQQWEEFVNFSEEYQNKLLHKIFDHKHHPEDNWDLKSEPASRKFGRIDKRTRISLKRQSDNPFVYNMEKQLIQFIEKSEEDNQLIVNIPSSFHRLITHGMCQYYCLMCKSFDAPNGDRMTCIKIPQNLNISVPNTLLSSYLKKQEEQYEKELLKLQKQSNSKRQNSKKQTLEVH